MDLNYYVLLTLMSKCEVWKDLFSGGRFRALKFHSYTMVTIASTEEYSTSKYHLF